MEGIYRNSDHTIETIGLKGPGKWRIKMPDICYTGKEIKATKDSYIDGEFKIKGKLRDVIIELLYLDEVNSVIIDGDELIIEATWDEEEYKLAEDLIIRHLNWEHNSIKKDPIIV